MTLQQIEYIIALNRHRHFGNAAASCNITQSTLSTMLQKLEDELGVRIFDRNTHPIKPTRIGEQIILQAERTLNEMRRIKEVVLSETRNLSGKLRIGIIPTVAPYLVPEFISRFTSEYPDIELKIMETRTEVLISMLCDAGIDIGIAATPIKKTELWEIPLYYEKFVGYLSPRLFKSENRNTGKKKAGLLPFHSSPENLWVLEEGHCARNQIFNFCGQKEGYNHIYESGSIDTLIKIVDKNGGYTFIPELHLPLLSPIQLENIVKIEVPPAVREISLIVRNDFFKERLLNAVADTIKKIIPESMLDERLKKFAIRL